jgi:hypothetical protein
MEQRSILSEKLQQHEFEYRGGAWENMEALLDNVATPSMPTSKPAMFSKWLKLLGAAAVIGTFATIAFIGSKGDENTPSIPLAAPSQQMTVPSKVEQGENVVNQENVNEKRTLSASQKTTQKDKKEVENDLIIPKEYQTQSVVPQLHPKAAQPHAEPVDDSKVYRENKNYKNPHLIINEHSKAPAASDLHHNN